MIGVRRVSGLAAGVSMFVAAALVIATMVVATPASAAPLPVTEAAANQTCPSGILVRRSVRDLSAADWTRFTNAVRKLQLQHPSGSAVSNYDTLVQRYLLNASQVRSNPVFLPWHRYYLRQFELRLQAIDPGLTIPYWDFGYLDSQAPGRSLVWTYLGHNGTGPDHAVPDGPFASWNPAYPQPHSLSRSWDQGDHISAWYSAEQFNSLLQSTTYDNFWRSLEPVVAGQVQAGIGGDMVTMAAPNDPVFLLVFAYVDKLWASWQERSPANATAYGGHRRDGQVAQSADQMPGFIATVRDTFNISSFCYRYDSNTVAPSQTS